MSEIDTSIPHSARVWNYWLGGKDNYQVDREAGDRYLACSPQIVTMARESREYLKRGVTYLAQDLGVRQFLDIGTGLPTSDNTHEVAQRIAPEAKVVYVDNDPVVLTHAAALLHSTAEGVTDYIDADLHDPNKILDKAGRVLDFDQPVALMLMGILGHIQDYDTARAIVRQLQAVLPPGGYFLHYDSVGIDEHLVKTQQGYDDTGAVPYILRSPEEIKVFYEGLDLIEPGIVSCPLWRPAPGAFPEPTDIYGGLGRVRRP